MKTTAVIAAVAGIAAAASGQNLLANFSWENAVNFDGNDVGNWNAFFGGAPFQQVEPVTPQVPATDGALALQIGTTGQADTFVGVTQTVGGIVAGSDYIFSFDSRTQVDMGANAEFRIEWRDSGGNFIGGQFDLTTPIAASSGFESQALVSTAPPGAASATVVIALQTFGGVPAPFEGFWQFDNAFFGIPAPSAAGALAMAGLVAARRRR